MIGQKGLNWICFILLALIWGSSFILMKEGAKQLSGWQIGAIRILSAGALALPFGLFHISRLPKNKIPVVLFTGLFGNLFPAFLFAVAIHRKVPSSIAGILNSLTPLFVVLIGVLFFKLKIQQKKLAGVLIGFIGLFILSITKGPVTVTDIGFTLLILLATVFYGLNVNIVSTYLKGIDPLKISSVSLSFLTLPSGLVLYFNPVSFSSPAAVKSILAVVTLGLLGSAAATLLFYVLIKRAGGLFASLVTYAVPAVAIFWGMLDNEQVGMIQMACLGIILVGVYLANK